MSVYQLALFVHVISDITLFMGAGAQLLFLLALRRAKDMNQVQIVVGLIPLTDWLVVAGALLTIASGFYMTLTVWGLRTSWILVALGSIVLVIAPLVRGIVEPRTQALVTLANEKGHGPLSPELNTRIQDPVLGVALHSNIGIVMGIVFLMTTKPSLSGAILAMLIALALGAASGFLVWRGSAWQQRLS